MLTCIYSVVCLSPAKARVASKQLLSAVVDCRIVDFTYGMVESRTWYCFWKLAYLGSGMHRLHKGLRWSLTGEQNLLVRFGNC